MLPDGVTVMNDKPRECTQGGLSTKVSPPGPVAITPTWKKAERVTCWSETQTTGGLGKHKDGGLLNRKALVLGLQAAVRSPRAERLNK